MRRFGAEPGSGWVQTPRNLGIKGVLTFRWRRPPRSAFKLGKISQSPSYLCVL